MSKKLNPCPFCGEQPEITYVPLYMASCWHIDCRNEGCPENPGTWYYYLRDAVSEWNEVIAK